MKATERALATLKPFRICLILVRSDLVVRGGCEYFLGLEECPGEAFCDPEMYDAVQRDCPEKKLGREARAVRILTFLDDETPQKKLAAFDTADLLRRRLSLEEPVAVPLPLESNRGAAA